ncbi:MAG: ABC transporter ATP-binding protein [Ktedonobacteraceae bacterium]
MLLLASTGLQLANPQVLRYFIDTAITGGATISLLVAALSFIGIALANQATSVATSYLSEYVAWTATNRLRTDLVAHCLSLDMAFHKTHTSGELIERIDGDVNALANFFSQFSINLLSNLLVLLGVLILLYFVDWRVGLAMTLFSLLALLVLMFIRRRAIPRWAALRQMSADFYGFLGEQLVGTEDIRGNGAVPYVMRRFYLFLRRWLPVNRRARSADARMWITALTMFNFFSTFGLALGAYLWSSGAITVGTVYLIFAYTDYLSRPIRQIQTQLQDLQQAEACIQRIEALLDTQSALGEGRGTPLPQGALSVEFRDVSFGYMINDTVIRDLTFHIEPGKVLGVMGRTGSGKTTLARLLFRLYDPQCGEICAGGVPIYMAELPVLRQRIGMVTQDVQLFHATVRDNLTFFNRSIPDERILEVLDDVGLTSWYRSLSDGLETELGSDGEGLSAGEAQLLAFTRVFLTNPGLVILDEASSRLDPATEYLIERALSKLFVGRTGIVIAHRLATIQRADDILIIEHGRLLEYGGREELASIPTSRFSQLIQTGLEEVRA